MDTTPSIPRKRASASTDVAAFPGGGLIGTLGGLIGLGGAEFRLPVLIGVFRYVALEAVILNKAMSLVVVASALLFRTKTISLGIVAGHWPTIVNLLAGSMIGAWLAAGWATRMRPMMLYRVMAVLLIVMAILLLLGHGHAATDRPLLEGWALRFTGVLAGFGIGIVASLLGVAGGELLIPTLILLFAVDIKTAGSLSLVVSLPTMLMGFFRYSRDSSFSVLSRNVRFALVMAGGSILGTFIGGHLLGIVPSVVLLPVLAAILLVSAVKVWRHE